MSSRTKGTRRLARAMWGALALALVACGSNADPAPTVGLARVIRGGFTLERGGRAERVRGPARVEDGAKVTAGGDGRGSVTMDTGAWVLFDRGASAELALTRLTLVAGRVWIDARSSDETTIDTGHGELVVAGATLAVARTPQGAEVYCASGEVTYRARGGEGRLVQGETARLPAQGTPAVAGEALWDDWTGGLADPTPRSRTSLSAVPTLAGRRLDERGVARTPLAVRSHEVAVTLDGDLATTRVEQTFFNARSDALEAEYRVRLPAGATVAGFAVDLGQGYVDGRVAPLATERGEALAWADPSVSQSSLAYEGADRLRARVFPVPPGATVRVKLVYTEWLARRADVRTYVYPMTSAGTPPLVGEFVLDVETKGPTPRAMRAGMGARVEGGKVVLRRSDFVPRADFTLDLFDAKPPPPGVVGVYEVAADARGGADGEERFVLLDVPVDDDAEPTEAPLELVLLVDVSGGTSPEDLELARGVVEAVTRQLAPTGRVAARRRRGLRCRRPAAWSLSGHARDG